MEWWVVWILVAAGVAGGMLMEILNPTEAGTGSGLPPRVVRGFAILAAAAAWPLWFFLGLLYLLDRPFERHPELRTRWWYQVLKWAFVLLAIASAVFGWAE